VGTDKPEGHRAAPRCPLTLHERANGTTTSLDGEAIQAWVERELEAMRRRVPVEVSRTELEALVEKSAELLETERHGLPHEGDRQGWGSRGGQGDRKALRQLLDGAPSPQAAGKDHGLRTGSREAAPVRPLR
jgi:hypothetical protein